MSVAYEPRSFIHDGAYPPIGDTDHDHSSDPDASYVSPDVPDLGPYSTAPPMLTDDRSLLPDGLTDEAVAAVSDAARLDLSASAALVPLAPLPEPLSSDNIKEDAEGTGLSSRVKCIPKPEREVTKQADGKFYCTFPGCTEEPRQFSRKCEWSKHMDKHERPYRCAAEGCEKLPGFTYSGGLLRHEREVHGKHGGPKNTVNCPHPNCKRHTGKGFSRQENLNEHLRRVHTNDGGTPVEDIQTSDGDSDKAAGMKRKRSSKSAETGLDDLREEIKRVRQENLNLRQELDRQAEHSLAMMAQIAQLQETLQTGLDHATAGLTAPTAPMM